MNILSDFLIRINDTCFGTEKVEIKILEKPIVTEKADVNKKVVKKTVAKKTTKNSKVVNKEKVTKTDAKSTKSKVVKNVKVPVVRKKELHIFSNLTRKTIKNIFTDFDVKILAKAIIGSDAEIEEKVTSAIGQSRGRRLRTALNKITNPSTAEIKEAREQIAEEIKRYFSENKQ